MNEWSFDKVAPIIDEGVKAVQETAEEIKEGSTEGNAEKAGAFVYNKGKIAVDFMAEQGRKVAVRLWSILGKPDGAENSPHNQGGRHDRGWQNRIRTSPNE